MPQLQPLFQVESPLGKSMQMLNQAGATTASMDKKKFWPEEPPKTVGGAMMSSLGGAGTMGAMGASGMLGATAPTTALATGSGAFAETAGMTSIAPAATLAGPWGLALGAALGAMAYFLS